MESIAMRMTKEEFDSIKCFITLPIYLNSNDFKKYCWVTNDRNTEGVVSNLMHANNANFDRKVYEYFDKDIFLNACDIEVEKVFKGSEIEFRPIGHDEWIHSLNYEFRFKPKPNYSKEIESLQEKAKLNGMKAIITFEKI